MNYPGFLRSGVLPIVLLTLLTSACESPDDAIPSIGLDIHDEVTIDEIRSSLANNDYSIVELTRFYLDRIDSLSFGGPQLNAVITVNPDALDIAARLDDEMKAGKIRGPLHGIPVLLKDNIDTADKMPCTAGSRAMKDSYPPLDSPIALQLRKAGAIILGKANLSEWANFHSTFSSGGWSGLGGQTRNPYDLTRNPSGSSSGSAVAVAANLCVLAIGTETSGSIVFPANVNGVVGIKPTTGLISRSGVIPISFSHDTAGPMARTVKDAALCLGSLTEIDSADSKTLQPGRTAHEDYLQFLHTDGIDGKRIGYWKSPLRDYKRISGVMEEAVAFFKNQGATIVELKEVVAPEARDHSLNVLFYEFKDGINNYLLNLGDQARVRDLEDLIGKTFADPVEMRYFDHELFKTAQSKGDLDSEDFRKSLQAMLRLSREEGIDKIMDVHQLDAIITAAGAPAGKTDLTNGNNIVGPGTAYAAAIAGYPNIVVPMGRLDGLPIGLSIFGRAWSEPELLAIAYSYEQGTRKRFTPGYLAGYSK